MRTNGISRRKFAQLVGVGAAAVAARPSFVYSREPSAPAATNSKTRVVRLSANENPYGPSPKAVKAMSDSFGLSCRYPDEHADALRDALAEVNGVGSDQILLGDGSSEILKLCAEAFTGPTSNNAGSSSSGRGVLVAADPTFEAVLEYARANGAEVIKVPLTRPAFSHDLHRMAAAAREGLIYVCNPNNPTASITPKNELRDFIGKAPRSTIILVDEAYYHYADSPEYESVIPLINDHPNLVVARTFSKVYGMAGLRCGYCVAQKETIDRLRRYQPWDSVNCMALAAAHASLSDEDQVANGRRLNSETRDFVLAELDGMGYKAVPSQANFAMVDLKRPVVPVIKALKDQNVQVGRLFPALPRHMRLTIGKHEEMQTFLNAFRQVVPA